jgi:hypothetical protein
MGRFRRCINDLELKEIELLGIFSSKHKSLKCKIDI